METNRRPGRGLVFYNTNLACITKGPESEGNERYPRKSIRCIRDRIHKSMQFVREGETPHTTSSCSCQTNNSSRQSTAWIRSHRVTHRIHGATCTSLHLLPPYTPTSSMDRHPMISTSAFLTFLRLSKPIGSISRFRTLLPNLGGSFYIG